MRRWSLKSYPYQLLTHQIIGAFYDVYNNVGTGFVESVYEATLANALETGGLHVDRQTSVPVWSQGRKVGQFRTDLIVEKAVILELKARPNLERWHEVQLLNLLRATRFELGLLLNFGPRPQMKRLVFSNSRKRGR